MNAIARLESGIDRSISNEIAVGSSGLTFQNAGQIMEYAKMMAVSGSAVPKHLRGNAGACLGIVDDALRFQMSPYALARKSYFVNDNLGYEAQVLAAIVISRSPLRERPNVNFEGEGQDRVCIVSATFNDGAEREVRSPAFKAITPKNSPLWKSDPDQQHSYYTLRAFARRHCPDVLLGMYDPEELSSMAARDVTPPRAPTAQERLKSIAAEKPAEPVLHNEGFGTGNMLEDAPASAVSEPEQSQADTGEIVDQQEQEPAPAVETRIEPERTTLNQDDKDVLTDFIIPFWKAESEEARKMVRMKHDPMIEARGKLATTAARKMVEAVIAGKPAEAGEVIGLTMQDMEELS
ncbi:recombinase RecT [Ahrensia sp. R2A130]|uniref:recombinase RecT n=1 Tax=Ahrensia sp. R2A130 TaxID=744979 RepID=UPI0001E0BCC8|nr:recombinase RecT [Ahrensia sp. R2A130]EFL88336.1 putative entero exodeoxyribonuclease VIII [Ahrensia sp. R2A130]